MESQPHNGKLEETVIGILKGADLDIATELAVRTEAEKLLRVDLSDLASKRLVRRVVESFLLSNSPVDEVREETEKVNEVQPENFLAGDGKSACDDGGGRLICKLPEMRRVSIQKFKGTMLVSIREYYEKHGKMFPSARGISLNPAQWSAFRSSFPDIEEAIIKMESKIRAEGIGKEQTEAEASNPSTVLPSEPRVLDKMQIEADTSVSSPHPLIPISTTRFTGKNYYCWNHQIEFFLNQLKISYVLIERCPKIPVSPQSSAEETSQAKTCLQKWMNDDYICRHTILNSLSDQLLDQYSVKTQSAKELWDDIKSFYADDFGTKRCHVNNYINFQMVDGVSVLEQVEELHRIAGIINTSGIHIDENFHVSVIISKLPPSWKHVRAKLMQEEYLPLDKLVYRLKDEEDSRSQLKRDKFGQRKKDTRVLCYGCGKEGHMRRDCPLTRSYSYHRDQSNRENATTSEVNVVDKVVL